MFHVVTHSKANNFILTFVKVLSMSFDKSTYVSEEVVCRRVSLVM